MSDDYQSDHELNWRPMNDYLHISVHDVENIAQAIQTRQTKFTDENFVMSVGVVLMNYGDRYVKVSCVGSERWTGTKGELEPREGIPLCPNGHPLIETSQAPRLSLVPS